MRRCWLFIINDKVVNEKARIGMVSMGVIRRIEKEFAL